MQQALTSFSRRKNTNIVERPGYTENYLKTSLKMVNFADLTKMNNLITPVSTTKEPKSPLAEIAYRMSFLEFSLYLNDSEVFTKLLSKLQPYTLKEEDIKELEFLKDLCSHLKENQKKFYPLILNIKDQYQQQNSNDYDTYWYQEVAKLHLYSLHGNKIDNDFKTLVITKNLEQISSKIQDKIITYQQLNRDDKPSTAKTRLQLPSTDIPPQNIVQSLISFFNNLGETTTTTSPTATATPHYDHEKFRHPDSNPSKPVPNPHQMPRKKSVSWSNHYTTTKAQADARELPEGCIVTL
jgi:hypothetical protein